MRAALELMGKSMLASLSSAASIYSGRAGAGDDDGMIGGDKGMVRPRQLWLGSSVLRHGRGLRSKPVLRYISVWERAIRSSRPRTWTSLQHIGIPSAEADFGRTRSWVCPMKTRAAVAFEAKKPLEIVELDLEGPRDGEVLIEIKATGICHTDAYTLDGLDSEGLFP